MLEFRPMTVRLRRTTPRESAKLLAAALITFALPIACSKEGDTIYIVESGGSAGTSGAGGSTLGEAGADSGGTGGPASSGGRASGGGSGTSAGGSPAGGSAGQASGGVQSGGTGGASGSTGQGGAAGSAGYTGALFVEDFEDGNYDGWALGPSTSTYAVSTATAANGSTRSMQISGGTGYFNGPNYMLGGIKPSMVSWWVRIADALQGGGEGYFVLSSDPNSGADLIYCFISQYAINFFPDFNVDTPLPMADHWYHFEVDIDWQAETYSVRMDGAAIGSGQLGGLPFNGIQRLDIFNANADGGDVVYWDEIVMMP